MNELARREPVALFNGAGPDDIIVAAGVVADRFSDIVKRQRMFKRIGDRDHILIEAWQTIGTLTGVFAIDDGRGVRELPWPASTTTGILWTVDEPPRPGAEPRNRDSTEWGAWKDADEQRKRFEHSQTIEWSHSLGRAWGYAAAFRAVKDGREIGWGEGRVDRSERTWAGRDDYALASMAQTRGQSRALGAPLRFIVKLAGYEPTLPDEQAQEGAQDASVPFAPWGPTVESDDDLQAAAQLVKAIAPDVDGVQFVLDMAKYFNGIPEANVKMLRGLLRRIGEAGVRAEPTEAPA